MKVMICVQRYWSQKERFIKDRKEVEVCLQDLLLSVVNTKLRDEYKNLDALCEDLSVEKEKLTETLKAIDYLYDAGQNQFI